MKIIRTKSKLAGGITLEEKARLDEHAKLWISRAMRTERIEPEKITPAIEGIYAAAGLKKPKVVIVPSPLVMAFAYGASAAILYKRKHAAATRDATRAATRAATEAATRDATRDATRAATYDATRDATYDATRDATEAATRAATYDATYATTYDATEAATEAATAEPEIQAANACLDMGGDLGIQCAKMWSRPYQGGNMWAGYDCFLSSFRDVLGLDLQIYEKYAPWEQAAIHGSFRVMHEDFCIVSDFPEILKVDEQNRPHCENGPSHRWRDGWELYYWHGVRIPNNWIKDKSSLDAKTALTWENIEQRRAALEIVGWHNVLTELDAKVIDKDGDPEIGTLLEVQLPDLEVKTKILHAKCGTGREFAMPVPPHVTTALEANAGSYRFRVEDFNKPEIRT